MKAAGPRQRVLFEGGPLDGRSRDIPADRVTWEPQGLPEKGRYAPAWPGALRWTWKEAN